MDKFKGKYEIILGFATLVISLSAFKEELSKINIDFVFVSVSLSKYFLYCVLGFALSLYLYIIEYSVRETKIGHLKIFNYLIVCAYSIFIFILLSPLLLLISFSIVKSYIFLHDAIRQNGGENNESIILAILQVVILLNIILSFIQGLKLFKNQQLEAKESIIQNQILELSNALKLYEEGFYANSIIEVFKGLEFYLQSKMLEKGMRPPKALYDLLSTALKSHIIKPEDNLEIKHLIQLRNISAHRNDITVTKDDAEKAIKFIQRITNQNN